jgi:UDP-N-acetylmuramoyl-tripeptide--D-alanyl-D-alanine ligase
MKTMIENKSILFTIEEVGEILGAKMEGAPEFHQMPISGVRIDSRAVEEGDLFVAVKGENHDGHDYVKSALEKGASAAVICEKNSIDKGLYGGRLIPVEDTVFALGQLAANYRRKVPARVIAVTGSNGKTTAKNITFEILSRAANSVKSQGNYNNFFGLPLSVFQIKSDTRFAVLELGMSRKGEISRLGEIASPDMAVITNIGPVHLEFFKNLNEIAAAKLEIVDRIRPGGILIVNGDDDYLREIKAPPGLKIVRFGLSYDNDFHPADLKFDENQNSVFKVNGVDFKLRLPGVHNVYNALIACAVAAVAGVDAHIAAEAIMSFQPEGMRSQVLRKSGVVFYIDCYNANPVSMKYAIDTLALMKCQGKRIAILGDMLELGKDSELYHVEIGKHAREARIDHLLAFGDYSQKLASEFGDKGEYFTSKENLYNRLRELLSRGDLVLFKGSRGMALEEVADRIMESM